MPTGQSTSANTAEGLPITDHDLQQASTTYLPSLQLDTNIDEYSSGSGQTPCWNWTSIRTVCQQAATLNTVMLQSFSNSDLSKGWTWIINTNSCQISCLQRLQDPSYTATPEYAESGEDWQQRKLAKAPDPDAFKADNLQACAPVLESLLSIAGSLARECSTGPARGYSYTLDYGTVPVKHASHTEAPNYQKKVEIVKRMLAKAVGKDNVENYLKGDKPAQVQIPNHK